MHKHIWSTALFAAALGLASCSDMATVLPDPVVTAQWSAHDGPAVRISEFHYDNVGTDVGEAIEVSAPAGTDMTGWTVVLYNGSGGAPYGTMNLGGLTVSTCTDRQVVFMPFAGIQNGAPDGMALVDAGGNVVEFLSYEGTFAAVGGPANGLTSTDIGVAQDGDTPIGASLQRQSASPTDWLATNSHTFGLCNDNGEPPPPAEVDHITIAPADAQISVGGTQQFTATAFDADDVAIPGVTFTWSSTAPLIATVNASGLATAVQIGAAEIIATAPNDVAGSASLLVVEPPPPGELRIVEIHYDNAGSDVGEAIEIEGPAGFDLNGWSVVLYNGNGGGSYNTQNLSGQLAATCGDRGVTVVNYPADGIQNGSPDGMALVGPTGVAEFLSYEGTFTATNGPAAGLTAVDIGVAESSSTPIGFSLQRDAAGSWHPPQTASFGACNTIVPGPSKRVAFVGRFASDPALPVGYEDQLFANLIDGTDTIPTTFTWSSETPAIASVDQNGVMRALSAGTAIIRATATDGTFGDHALPTRIAIESATASYEGNAEFGEPADADPSDDFIVRHRQFTSSYNRNRGIPNWVSYNLEATHFGPEDRCDCFTFDGDLPPDFPRYTTADYTGAGAFHGYGIDRGHLARSFDRTAASLDNARTYLFTNILPQAADNNQGPWAAMENFLGDLARFQNKEVYIIAGGAGSKGTVKDEGKVTIPAHTWKVAVVMERDHGLAQVDDYQDLEVIAVIMPNDPGIRNVDWNNYRTTVDEVEALSGYDLLALLADHIEIAVESQTHPPVAVVNGPFMSIEGLPVAMSAAGSSDQDGDVLTYAWTFGDGGAATGSSVSHTYQQAGTFTVRLIVTDTRGLADTTSTTATVLTRAQALEQAIVLVQQLRASGQLNAGNTNALVVKLQTAQMQFERDKFGGALGPLKAALNEIGAFVGSGKLIDADVAQLRELLRLVMTSTQ